MINKVILVGHLGGDPEIKETKNNKKIAHFSIATTKRSKNKETGERNDKTYWHRVTCYGSLAETAEKHLTKGSKVYIEGELINRKWDDEAGNTRYLTEVSLPPFNGKIVFLDKKESGRQETPPDEVYDNEIGDDWQ